jgi:hypothetical protein
MNRMDALARWALFGLAVGLGVLALHWLFG